MIFKRVNVTRCVYRRSKHVWQQPEGHDTNIKIYNCLAREKVPLIVPNKNCVTWYSCGPTVYDSAHIGHASSYVKLDIIQRILRNRFNLNLVTVMNITDIDDKIINRSKSSGLPHTEVSKKYEHEFWQDLRSLRVQKPNVVVKVTDNISLIRNFIKSLVASDKAYTNHGSVYFDLSKSPDYGKLQNIGTPEPQPTDKKNLGDFALWKSTKPGEPSWESEWGPGRPGWHIECSAMAGAVFGHSIDIHAGGIDLRFPHHENEEAQSCAFYDTDQWVNYWVHTGHLHLQHQEKMSKSLKNTVSIQEMLEGVPADVFRMACLMSHYRSDMEYSAELLQTAEAYWKRIKSFLEDCDAYIDGKLPHANVNKAELLSLVSEASADIQAALQDDFNTAKSLQRLMELVNATNKMICQPPQVTETNLNNCESVVAVANFMRNTLSDFGLDCSYAGVQSAQSDELDNALDVLTGFRQRVRNIALVNKDAELLRLCDQVRDDAKLFGFVIKDHGKLSSWSK